MAKLGRNLYEVPVGFKWFVDGLFNGSLCFGGEESAGASFVRLDGSVWTTDKDGIIPCLLAAEITARTGKDPGVLYGELTREFGEPAYDRVEAPATPAEKAVLLKMCIRDSNHDVYAGAWSRFNSTLKWWGWVYAGIILTLGANNLGSRSRLCRYGTVLLLLPSLAFGYDLASHFARDRKESAASIGIMTGSGWIDRDMVIKDLIIELASRPDGITVESGLKLANTDTPAVSLFAGKQSLLGWPWHETTWRGPFIEIHERQLQIDAFYAGTIDDPLNWLLHNLSLIHI